MVSRSLGSLSGLNIKKLSNGLNEGIVSGKSQLPSPRYLRLIRGIAGLPKTVGRSKMKELKVIEQVQDIKGFYTHLAIFFAVRVVFVDEPSEFA